MEREFGEEKVLAPYLAALAGAPPRTSAGSGVILPDRARHV